MIKNRFTKDEINTTKYNNYIDNILKCSILNYQNISLDTDTQNDINIIIKGNKAYITSVYYGILKECFTCNIIDEIVPSILAKHINITGYYERTFTSEREYNFKDIIESDNSDISFDLSTIKLLALCKAVASESFKDDEIYFIDCVIGCDYIKLYDFNKCDELNNILRDYADFNIDNKYKELFEEIKNDLLIDERIENYYINVDDLQYTNFAIGRIWKNKQELLQQVYAWLDYEDDNKIQEHLIHYNLKDLIHYINDMWTINIVPYDNNNDNHNMLFLEHYKEHLFFYKNDTYNYIKYEVINDTLNTNNYLIIIYGISENGKDEIELYHYEITKSDILDLIKQVE